MSLDPPPTPRLWLDARLATLSRSAAGLGIVERGAVAVSDDRIVYAGPEADLPSALKAGADIHDCEGRWITPGLIDCHTHLVYAGNRARDFELRLQGVSYEQIARAGGGIVSSVRATREASHEQLIQQSLPRLDALLAEGVTTIEIKSGYGLDLDSERKMLQTARRLTQERNVTVSTTFLGAHALPPESTRGKDDYIDNTVLPMLRILTNEGLVDAVDAFCESIAFSPEQVQRVFKAAAELGLPVKLHADQLSNLRGAALAADHHALSADHLEHTDEHSIAAMAASGTVAVMLPGAFYFLRDQHRPPVARLRQHGVAMAVATDCNPGTSPLTSLLLAMNMAATQFGMTVEECIAGVTREAARALGMAASKGSLEPGKHADLAIWNVESLSELVYRMGFNPLFARIWRGR
ncbi:imidazolonepropionase [Peristeroidobacter soli]|uniref:imidazolonepropionase n=1 Tax=Peristeroidobacter soli TaxID=2497877 RepID=UPI00101D736B|nr:imidazolonepropionase [Peristeroidobacter soli]